MNQVLFKKFYDETIEPIAINVYNNNTADIRYRENLDGVYEEYLNQIALFRLLLKNISGNSQTFTEEQKNTILLDRHKVSSCITNAIIRSRVITSKTIQDDEQNKYNLVESSRMNEHVAVLCGVSCLLQFMAEETDELIIENGIVRLNFPETNNDSRPHYLNSLVRGLYYTNIISNINPLMLAHVFFFIEKYHKQSVELQKLRDMQSP